jgi:hypothetical protein
MMIRGGLGDFPQPARALLSYLFGGAIFTAHRTWSLPISAASSPPNSRQSVSCRHNQCLVEICSLGSVCTNSREHGRNSNRDETDFACAVEHAH